MRYTDTHTYLLAYEAGDDAVNERKLLFTTFYRHSVQKQMPSFTQGGMSAVSKMKGGKYPRKGNVQRGLRVPRQPAEYCGDYSTRDVNKPSRIVSPGRIRDRVRSGSGVVVGRDGWNGQGQEQSCPRVHFV